MHFHQQWFHSNKLWQSYRVLLIFLHLEQQQFGNFKCGSNISNGPLQVEWEFFDSAANIVSIPLLWTTRFFSGHDINACIIGLRWFASARSQILSLSSESHCGYPRMTRSLRTGISFQGRRVWRSKATKWWCFSFLLVFDFASWLQEEEVLLWDLGRGGGPWWQVALNSLTRQHCQFFNFTVNNEHSNSSTCIWCYTSMNSYIIIQIEWRFERMPECFLSSTWNVALLLRQRE